MGINMRKKNPSEEREHEDEKYKFIKEQIKPQRRKAVFNFFQKIAGSAVLAVVFGVIAGVVFVEVNSRYGNDLSLNSYDDIQTSVPMVTPSVQVPENTSNSAYIITKNDILKNEIVTESLNKASRQYAEIGNAFSASIVQISKNGKISWYANAEQATETTSGMILKETGKNYYIITSEDISYDDSVTVCFDDNYITSAKLVGNNRTIGFSVIKVNKADIPKETMEAIEIPVFAITSTVPVGSKVIAVGAPNGVMNSVMIGSVVKSNIPTSVIDNQISLFLTDITLSQKSNGIIINSKGKVIGFINNSFSEVTGESGIGFIGISSIMDIINRISMGKDVPYFGIEGCDINEWMAKAHNIEVGVYVTSVYANSPAYVAGMRITDVIKKVNGKTIKYMYQFHNIIMESKAGDTINVEISRKSNDKNIDKKLKIVLK